tara:strand:- start:5068 stop:5346 length:279 start_codon:yes stop_codon:yes gene_type:complete
MNKFQVMRIENTKRRIQKQLELQTGRPVQVSFSHLGKNKEYSVAIQKTLYEFDGEGIGSKGIMYLSLNTTLLQSKAKLSGVVTRIASMYRSE